MRNVENNPNLSFDILFQLIFCILILASATPPRGSIPLTLCKEDIQLTLEQTNWLKGKVWNNESNVSQGYADVHDFFMTLPSGSCSQLTDANDLEGEVTEFTRAIGTHAQNFVKISNINYYGLSETQVTTEIFNKLVDGTANITDFQEIGDCTKIALPSMILQKLIRKIINLV